MQEHRHILSTYGAPLARVVASYSRPGPDREDLAQEVAAAVLQAMPRFRGESSEKTFVLRVAHNVGMRHAMRRRQRAHDPLKQEVPSDRRSPEGDALHSDRRRRLHWAVRQLPIAQRQVLTLALEDLSHREIARTLGISENAVATRLHRAKAALRDLLEAP